MINIFLLTVLALVVIAAFVVTCHKEPECLIEPDYMRYEFGTGEGAIDSHNDIIMPGSFTLGDFAKKFGLKAHCLNDPVDYDNLNEIRDEIINEATADIMAYALITGVNEITREQIDWYIQKAKKELSGKPYNHKPKL